MPNWYKHIDKIGIELEGGFHPDNGIMNTRVYGDGSVSGVQCWDDDGDSYPERCVEGEVSTPPLKSWGRLEDFLDCNFPEHVNDTCGTHLHISTKTINEYNTILCRDFYDSFVDMLNRYGDMHKHNVPDEWFTRLEGGNTYCENEYCPTMQLREDKPSARYRFLNYCYSTHGTVEVRVLPAFDNSRDLLKAVKYIVPWVNSYIDTKLPDSGRTWTQPPITIPVNDTYPTNIKRKYKQLV
jgi:hypothetical protein